MRNVRHGAGDVCTKKRKKKKEEEFKRISFSAGDHSRGRDVELEIDCACAPTHAHTHTHTYPDGNIDFKFNQSTVAAGSRLKEKGKPIREWREAEHIPFIKNIYSMFTVC